MNEVMVAQPEVVHSKIEDMIAERDRAHREIVELCRKNKDVYDRVLDQFPEVGYHWLDYSGLNVSVAGTKSQLLHCLKVLYAAGLKPETKNVKDGTSYSSHFYNHDRTVCLYFTFSSTQCRKVKVGTKTQVVDVYEVQCDDALEDMR